MNISKISSSVYYIGVDDHKTRLFESLWPLPHGVSYNSYIVKGEKTALIDTVEAHCSSEYLDHIHALGVTPDYLVVNHMEPDHSGAMTALAAEYPHMKIVGNRLTLGMIRGFYPEICSGRFVEVQDGEVLSLGGGIDLSFHTIPMVHWPETMATYLASEGVLFSGDAFGTFGALNGRVLDTEIDATEMYFDEMYRYYACIVAKYAAPVQKALAKLHGIDIKKICSTHGPVWSGEAGRVIAQYDAMSSGEAQRGVTVVCGSMYGHTWQTAQVLAGTMEAQGITVRLHDASRTDLSFILADIWRYKGLLIGSATYNASVLPPIQALLSALEMRGLSRRVAAAFGNYTWAPAAAQKIDTALRNLGLDMAAYPVQVKMTPQEADISRLRTLAQSLAGRL